MSAHRQQDARRLARSQRDRAAYDERKARKQRLAEEAAMWAAEQKRREEEAARLRAEARRLAAEEERQKREAAWRKRAAEDERDAALLELARLREVEKAARAVLEARERLPDVCVDHFPLSVDVPLTFLSSALSPLPTKEST